MSPDMPPYPGSFFLALFPRAPLAVPWVFLVLRRSSVKYPSLPQDPLVPVYFGGWLLELGADFGAVTRCNTGIAGPPARPRRQWFRLQPVGSVASCTGIRDLSRSPSD